MGERDQVQVTVRRHDGRPGEPGRLETFKVPFLAGMSVSGALKLINELFDGGLAHYLSCRRGLCAGCVVRVNGRPARACTEPVQGDLVLEPVATDRVVRDLVYDYAHAGRGMPRPGGAPAAPQKPGAPG